MVRPIRPDENDEANFKYGDLGSGFMGGNSGSAAATGAGAFTGQSEGTGFVNAKDYLGANMGKGAALGEDLTKDVTGLTGDINSQLSDLKNLKTDSKVPEGKPFDPSSLNRSSDALYKDAEKYRGHPNAYKGPGADDIDARFNALEKLRMGDPSAKKEGAESLQKSFDPTDPSSRDLRERRLDTKAKDAGISYGSGSRGFDAMFMESESPDLFKSKYDALTNALKGYDGLSGVASDKKAGAAKSTAEATAYDDALANDLQTAGDKAWEREHPNKAGAGQPAPEKTDLESKGWVHDKSHGIWYDPNDPQNMVDENGQHVDSNNIFA